MDQVQRFRIPIVAGVATLVLVLVVYLSWISPEGSKVTLAHTTQSSLVAQEGTLQAQVNALRADKDKVPTNCSQLLKVNTEIPAAPDQAQFIIQLSTLAHNSGNPGTPELSWGGGATAAPGKTGTSGIVAVPFSLSLGGTYQQILDFLDGIQNFSTINRLVTISTTSIGSGASTPATISVGPALAPQNATGYSLAISGDVYYNPALSTACDSLVSSAAPTTLAAVPPTTFPTVSTLPLSSETP